MPGESIVQSLAGKRVTAWCGRSEVMLVSEELEPSSF